MRAYEEAVPVPHLFVVAGGDEVVVLDEAFGGADGLRLELGVGGGDVGERLGEVVRFICRGSVRHHTEANCDEKSVSDLHVPIIVTRIRPLVPKIAISGLSFADTLRPG